MKRILVVEDEDILREVIVDYLIEDGYKVLETAEGEKASKACMRKLIKMFEKPMIY